jgi:hypothetical protein
MNLRYVRPTCWSVFAAVICWCAAATATAADSRPKVASVWPLTPYQVQVYVAMAPQHPLTPRLQEELCLRLAQRIDVVIGGVWNAQVSPAPASVEGAMLRNLAALEPKEVPLPTPEGDKVLFVAVSAVPGGLLVTARDYDVYTRSFSLCVERKVWQTGVLGDAAFDALWSAFAPMGRVEAIEQPKPPASPTEVPKDQTAEEAKKALEAKKAAEKARDERRDVFMLRIKGIGLPLRDRHLTLIHPGDVFQPHIRINERDGRVRTIFPSQWNFCVVEKVMTEGVEARLYSGMRAAFSARGRGRQETLVVRVVPPEGPTMVTLKSRLSDKGPLADYDVYATAPGTPADAPLTLLGRTDRQGKIKVPPAPGLLRVLTIKSATATGTAPPLLLARLPLVPGLEPQITAEMAPHDRRVEAEGFLFGLQEEFVDVAFRRKILEFRVQRKIRDEKDFEGAKELLDQLDQLARADIFASRIMREEDKLTADPVDATVKKKIVALLADTRKLIEKVLDTENIDALQLELRETKEAADEEAKPKPKGKDKGKGKGKTKKTAKG